MDARKIYLSKLHEYIDGVDKEVTMILQSLQWDRKNLLEGKATTSCQYDSGHRAPVEKLDLHEKECKLKSIGYSKLDKLLPDPPDPEYKTVVKLSSENIDNIINNAARNDPNFRRGKGSQRHDSEPLSLERLQETYTADERRAIHDAVVEAVPSSHDLSDLALTSTIGQDNKATSQKSRLEILSELRDMKRRRTKYRVAAKTKNYSDILRDVIKTQMELYTETQAKSHCADDNYETKDQYNTNTNYNASTNKNNTDDKTYNKHKREHSRDKETHKYEKHKKRRYETENKSASKYYTENKIDSSRHYESVNKDSFKNDYIERNKHNSGDRKDIYKYKDKKQEREGRYTEHKERKRHDDFKRDDSYDKSRRDRHREESTSSSRREYKDSERKNDSRSKYERKDEERPRRYYDTDY